MFLLLLVRIASAAMRVIQSENVGKFAIYTLFQRNNLPSRLNRI